MNYWSDLFTPETFEAFGRSDRTISGFRESQPSMADKVRVGDKFICYESSGQQKSSRKRDITDIEPLRRRRWLFTDDPFSLPRRWLFTDDPFPLPLFPSLDLWEPPWSVPLGPPRPLSPSVKLSAGELRKELSGQMVAPSDSLLHRLLPQDVGLQRLL